MDKTIITQTFRMARWQIVVKKSEATNKPKTKTTTKQKQNKKQTNNNDNINNKAGGGGREVIKQITNRMLS